MKIITILTLSILLSLSAMRADGNDMTDERFRAYFDNVTLKENAVVVTLRKGGARFLYSVNKDEPKKSEDGQEIVVPFGSTLTLVDKHTRVVFSPLGEPLQKKGLFVEELEREPGAANVISRKAILLLSQVPARDQTHEKGYRLIEPDVEKAKRLAPSN